MTEFKSIKGLGSSLKWLLLIQMVFSLLLFALTVFSVTIFKQVMFEDVEPQGSEVLFVLVFLGSALLSLVLLLVTAVVFMVWLSRAYANLQAIKVHGLSYAPHYAYWTWIVPIISLFMPFKMVMEVRNGSKPEDGLEIHRQADSSSTGFHLTWWILWVTSNIVSNASFRMSFSEDERMYELSSYLDVISLLLTIPCAYLAYEIVKEITEDQTALMDLVPVPSPPEPSTFEGMS